MGFLQYPIMSAFVLNLPRRVTLAGAVLQTTKTPGALVVHQSRLVKRCPFIHSFSVGELVIVTDTTGLINIKQRDLEYRESSTFPSFFLSFFKKRLTFPHILHVVSSVPTQDSRMKK